MRSDSDKTDSDEISDSEPPARPHTGILEEHGDPCAWSRNEVYDDEERKRNF